MLADCRRWNTDFTGSDPKDCFCCLRKLEETPRKQDVKSQGVDHILVQRLVGNSRVWELTVLLMHVLQERNQRRSPDVPQTSWDRREYILSNLRFTFVLLKFLDVSDDVYCKYDPAYRPCDLLAFAVAQPVLDTLRIEMFEMFAGNNLDEGNHFLQQIPKSFFPPKSLTLAAVYPNPTTSWLWSAADVDFWYKTLPCFACLPCRYWRAAHVAQKQYIEYTQYSTLGEQNVAAVTDHLAKVQSCVNKRHPKQQEINDDRKYCCK